MSRVSVVIATFNYGRFITDAVDSVLAQTVPVSEIIIIDDGSTDDTESRVREFGTSVRYIWQENMGVSAARNRGVRESSGDLVAFLDADDTWDPQVVEKQVNEFLSDDEIGLVHCASRVFDSETGETVGINSVGKKGWVADDLLLFEEPSVNGCVIMVSREAFDSAGGFDERLKIGEDWDLCYRIARRFKVGFVPDPVVNVRSHGTNSHLNVKEMERSTTIAWNKAFDTDDENVLRLRGRALGNLHKVLAGSYLKNRQYFESIRHVLKSVWFRPSILKYYLSRSRRNR